MATGAGSAVVAGFFLAGLTGWEMYRCHRKDATRMSHRWTRRGITAQWVPRVRNPSLYRRNMLLLGFFCLLGLGIAIGGTVFPSVIR